MGFRQPNQKILFERVNLGDGQESKFSVFESFESFLCLGFFMKLGAESLSFGFWG